MLSELPRDFSSLPSIYFAVPGVGGTVWGVLSERDSKQKFPPFAQDTPVPPCRSKICSKSPLSLTIFEILTLFHFPQKSEMATESGEN